MQNDYKKALLRYLTGNIDMEYKQTTPLYAKATIERYTDTNIVAGMQVVRCKDGKGNYNGKDLYYSRNGNTISLVNSKDMSVIKTFTTFSSGTNLGTILNLDVDEVGNIYGLDYITVGGAITYRIILLNNISEIAKGSNDYEVILRNSYYIQGYDGSDNLSPSFPSFIGKSTQSATYYFAISNISGDELKPSTFQIVVGGSNTWTRLEDILVNGTMQIGNIYFDGDDTPIAEYYSTELVSGDYTITRAEAVGENMPNYSTIAENIVGSYFYDVDLSTGTHIDLFSSRYNGFYMCISGAYKSGAALYSGREVVCFVNEGNVTKLKTYDSANGETLTNIKPTRVRARVINGVLMLYIYDFESTSEASIALSLVSENNDVDYLVRPNYRGEWQKLAFARFGVYCLYDMYIMNVIYELNNSPRRVEYTAIYNEFSYNGSAYSNVNMLVPREGVLLDIDNNLLFARQLYNLKVYNNQTMAVLNVPNNMLNNTTIVYKKLYGDTNKLLVQDTTNLDKNVYENVYINFINALRMENQNDNVYIANPNGAIRLNQSISKNLDYESAKATKIRVVYDDNTSYVTMASNSITSEICTYVITVHVPSDKNISRIEIISNDENTIYQTITNLNLENNKYYKIYQFVKVL